MDIWVVSSSFPLQMALIFLNKHSMYHSHVFFALLAHPSGLTSDMEPNFDASDPTKSQIMVPSLITLS